ncbi:coiled-coil and C2 domain-containing protein 1-like [Hermetia illucens]|nr:coiled-coil and C2 domain-containing protein 1-like [Hermetia illucens]
MENGVKTPTEELDKRIADVIQDIDKDVDDDVSEADENDPELLAELAKITGASRPAQSGQSAAERDTRSPVIVLPTTLMSKIQILKSRLEMYELAEKAAKEAKEEGRERRFARGIQTINEMLKTALNGDDVKVEDIPPEVSMKNVPTEAEETGVEAKEKA